MVSSVLNSISKMFMPEPSHLDKDRESSISIDTQPGVILVNYAGSVDEISMNKCDLNICYIDLFSDYIRIFVLLNNYCKQISLEM